jgi:hypothetical protein
VAALLGLAALPSCTPTAVAAAACADRSVVVTLSEPAGTVTPVYRPVSWGEPLVDGAGVDARAVEWVVPLEGFETPAAFPARYAVYLGARTEAGHADVCFVGGSILHEAPHETTTWSDWHAWDAAVVVSAPRAEVIGTRLFNVADGIALALAHAEDWTLRGIHVRQAHDDCVENDNLHSGLLEDAFLDGCYVAFSAKATEAGAAAGVDGTGETVTIRSSLLRLQPMPHVSNPDRFAQPGHGGFFKMGAVPGHGRSPRLEVHDSVFVLETHPVVRASDPSVHDDLLPTYDPDGDGPLPPEPYLAPDDCSGNTVVWLGDGEPRFGDLPACRP